MAGQDPIRAVARSPYWREADARQVVEAWRRSGEGLAAFCRRYQMKAERVARWASRLAEEPVRCNPVELVGAERDGTNRDDLALELALPGGETIRVPAGFAIEDLRRVLRVLDERPRC